MFKHLVKIFIFSIIVIFLNAKAMQERSLAHYAENGYHPYDLKFFIVTNNSEFEEKSIMLEGIKFFLYPRPSFIHSNYIQSDTYRRFFLQTLEKNRYAADAFYDKHEMSAQCFLNLYLNEIKEKNRVLFFQVFTRFPNAIEWNSKIFPDSVPIDQNGLYGELCYPAISPRKPIDLTNFHGNKNEFKIYFSNLYKKILQFNELKLILCEKLQDDDIILYREVLLGFLDEYLNNIDIAYLSRPSHSNKRVVKQAKRSNDSNKKRKGR